MALVSRSFKWRPSADGTCSGAFPDGDKIPVATLAWGSLAALASLIATQITGGSSFSHNVRQYLTGTAAATATISIVQVSGDDAATESWTISGNNLTHNNSSTGAGAFRLRATDTGLSADSEVLIWLYIAPVTDSIAPTIPTGITGVSGPNKITWTWDASSDPHTSIPGKGVKEYDLKFNGSTLATVVAQAGLNLPLTVTNLNSAATAPTANQTGSDWSCTARGSGVGTASDQGLFVNTPIDGDFFIVLKVNALTCSTNFANCGPMIRETLDAGSKYVYFLKSVDTAGVGIRGRARAQTNATPTVLSTLAGIGTGVFLKLERAGSLFTLSYSTTGGSWIALVSTTVAMSSSAYAGFFLSSNDVNNTATATVQQLNINNAPRVSYEQSTTVAGSLEVRARDLETSANVSAYSAAVSATPTAVANALKWNPGVYILLDGTVRANNMDTLLSSWTSQIAAQAGNDEIVGFKIFMQWGAAEIATAPDQANAYTAGFNFIDSLLTACRNVGKQLWISFLHVVFGGTSSDLNPYFPNYIWANPSGLYGWTAMANGKISRLWQTPTMDRVIAQMAAYGARYNSDPNIEGVQIDETAISVALVNGAYPDGFSTANVLAQYKRGYTAFRQSWPNTCLRVTTNNLGSEDNMANLLAHCCGTTLYCAAGPPDTLPAEGQQGIRIFTGSPTPGSKAPQTLPIVDYRSKVPGCMEVQSPEMGGHEGNYTYATLRGCAFSGYNTNITVNGQTVVYFCRPLEPSYVFWYKKEWAQPSTGLYYGSNPPSGGLFYSRVNNASHPDQYPIAESIAADNGAVMHTGAPDNYPGIQ